MKRAEQLVEKGNAAAAFTLLAREAKNGHVEAQYRVGRAYLEAAGVPPSATEAAHWLERAAQSGHVGAQARLAAPASPRLGAVGRRRGGAHHRAVPGHHDRPRLRGGDALGQAGVGGRVGGRAGGARDHPVLRP
ncbi:MAG: hypothetical protein WDN49_22040 [Acetobacteraceae bacterium]